MHQAEFAKQIRITMHVDDPMIIVEKSPEGQRAWKWFLQKLEDRFTIKKVDKLEVGKPIDLLQYEDTAPGERGHHTGQPSLH